MDIGTALPRRNSSAWPYAHAGMVGGERLNPLAAFDFGSFRNLPDPLRRGRHHRLPMVLSVRAAAGFEDGHYRKTEWLASLKIM